jgi:hypothetical protein
LPATSTEKPRVENRVFDLQRQWATPVPQVTDLAQLNNHLRQCCLQARERTCGGQMETVGARFQRDQAAALAVPKQLFDACVVQVGHVDKYQAVRFDSNSYSVPRRFAFRPVTVKGYIDRVAVVADGQVIACHPRSYSRHERVLDPLHYLVILERKPAALDHAPVYRDWQLPPTFALLRTDLEAQLGKATGARHYIRVLQLLATHPVERLAAAITACRKRGNLDARIIRTAVDRLASDIAMSLSRSTPPVAVTIPLPDLSRFNRLLSQTSEGEHAHAGDHPFVAESQPETAATAGHAGRV